MPLLPFDDNPLFARRSRWEYLLYCILLALAGVGIHLLLSGQAFHHYSPLNATELKSAFEMYKNIAFPIEISDFLGIFWGNFRALLILVVLPVAAYWCILILFSLNKRGTKLPPTMAKPISYISMIFFGYNSFTSVYPRFCIYPFPIFYTHYIYHGIIEIPTFFIAAVWSLHNLDRMDDDIQAQPPLSWHQRVKNSFLYYMTPVLFGLVFLAFAAYIETQITPYLILNSYKPYIGS